jgi:hypothetical protein
MNPTAYLQKVRRSLSFSSEHAAQIADDADHWDWLAIGLVMALQASLVVALTGYETANPSDVLDPSNAAGEKQAPVALMLRRVRSADYLNPPERLDLPVSASKGAQKLLAHRNAVMHGPTDVAPPETARHAGHTLNIIEHLLLLHPAFDSAPHTIELTHIGDHIDHIRRHLDALG